MRKCSADVNHIRLHGAVGEAPVYSHLNHGVEFYTFPLVVRRLSGAEDQVNVVAPLELLECCGPLERESELTVLGEVRTFNNRTGVGSRLVISAFARELRQELEKIFLKHQEYCNMFVTVLSFGFKYGIPEDADLVFDVRFLPNPFYIQELKEMTGNDEPVSSYVMSFEESRTFLKKLVDMLEFLIPHYIKEGKNSLVISIGCTGGKHRSVTLTNALYNALGKDGHTLLLKHNDIEKDSRHKK